MFGYYAACWRKYGVFSGRSRRREFWFFTLVNFIINTAGQLTIGIVAPAVWTFLSFGYSIAVLVPTLAVTARRLHDTGRSGWLQALPLAPLGLLVFFFIPGITASVAIFLGVMLVLAVIVISIVLLVFYCQRGTPGVNRFGPNPKEVAES
ncbi:MAG: DUF805 domain-containing protein [Kiritimatiellae bacterium]|nr:DUF805 domain-containing protein [Kiritimatiellia bacterium]